MDSPTFDLLLGAATLSCALVTGLLGSFAAIVMPGIGTFDDRDFLRTFAAIDRVIQRNQPLFIATWAGSVLSLLAVTSVGIAGADGPVRVLLVVATALYLSGVQLPTMVVNVPLNNRLQATDLDAAPTATVTALRSSFEERWNRWNRARSLVGLAVVLLLLLAGRVA